MRSPAIRLDATLDVLWRELHRRYGANDRRVGTVTLTGLDRAQRDALADLLRNPTVPPPTCRVDTRRLAAALKVDEDGLRALVEARFGPAGNRAAARNAAAAARAAAVDQLSVRAGGDPALAAWVSRQAVGSGPNLERRTAMAAAVLDVVTARRPTLVPLPVAAAAAFGDPHALDADQPAGRMLVAALAERAGTAATPGARTRRRLLRSIGLVADELSSTVTAYRLPVAADHPLAAALSGPEPAAITLGQLIRAPLSVPGPVTIRVVENPAVVSHAALTCVGLPIVCTSGIPSVAALELVAQLIDAGCPVLAHADFDAAGLTIVTQLATVGATPWQMTADVYQEAAARSAALLETGPADVAWEPGLAAVMRQVGKVGFEEHLLDRLLADRTPQL